MSDPRPDDVPSPLEAAGMPDLAGLLGGGGGFGDLLAGAQQAMAASQAASQTEVEGSSGGGVVKVRATGGGDVLGVTIDPVVVDPDDVAGLEDLVLAALRDVNAKVAALHQQAMSGAMGGMDPSALLGGLLGGGDDDDDWDEDDGDGDAIDVDGEESE